MDINAIGDLYNVLVSINKIKWTMESYKFKLKFYF